MRWIKSVAALSAKYKPYSTLAIITLFSYIPFQFAYLLEDQFHRLVDTAQYLTWHNLFEFTGMLVCFAVFITVYYTYEQTNNLKSIILGSIFLASGVIDAFHTLSYLGMPAFFIENISANRATTFWIIGRLTMSGGLLVSAFLSKGSQDLSVKKPFQVDKKLVLAPVIVFCIFVFIIPTYRPEAIPVMYQEGTGLTVSKVFLEYVIIALFAGAIAVYLSEYKADGGKPVLNLTGALVLDIFSELAFVSYSSVYDIYNYLGHVYKVIASYLIFKAVFIQNIRQPYIELTEAKTELTRYAENLDRIVDKRTRQLRDMNEKFIEDLQYARDIQKAVLPATLPTDRSVSFSTRYFPAEQVSGDFFSIFRLDADNIGFYIGDVSGHGVPAAMLTIFMNQSIKVRSETGAAEGCILRPSEVLQHVYDAFNNTNFRDEMYVVMLYGIFNTKTRGMVCSSAGLNVQPLIQLKDGEVRKLDIKGFPICKMKEIYVSGFEDLEFRLETGDKVLFFTDGLIDCENSADERYSEERLLEVIRNNAGCSAEGLSKALESSLFEFTGNTVQIDDVTFFILQVD